MTHKKINWAQRLLDEVTWPKSLAMLASDQTRWRRDRDQSQEWKRNTGMDPNQNPAGGTSRGPMEEGSSETARETVAKGKAVEMGDVTVSVGPAETGSQSVLLSAINRESSEIKRLVDLEGPPNFSYIHTPGSHLPPQKAIVYHSAGGFPGTYHVSTFLGAQQMAMMEENQRYQNRSYHPDLQQEVCGAQSPIPQKEPVSTSVDPSDIKETEKGKQSRWWAQDNSREIEAYDKLLKDMQELRDEIADFKGKRNWAVADGPNGSDGPSKSPPPANEAVLHNRLNKVLGPKNIEDIELVEENCGPHQFSTEPLHNLDQGQSFK